MEYTLQQFCKLTSIDSPSGYTDNVAEYTCDVFSQMGFKAFLTNKGCVAVDLGGQGQPLAIAAHIDTLGAVVAQIKPNGRLRIVPVGGLTPQNIEAENCVVITRCGKKIDGCMQLINASVHVNASYGDAKRNYESMEVVLDSICDSKEQAEKLGIQVGDYVCFCPRTTVTDSGYIKSRFIDDKMSVALLMRFAKKIKDENILLKRKTYVYITVFEEVGHGCASLPFEAEEILCVDMGCVGAGLECDERKVSICVKDSSGPYDYKINGKLIQLAKANNLPFALDVYPFYGSDASAALRSGHDVRASLIGSGVYASHGYERTHKEGVEATFKLLCAYVLGQI